MTHLAHTKKIDLLTVVRELGLEVPENSMKPQLIELIRKLDSYNENFVKNLLIGIVSER